MEKHQCKIPREGKKTKIFYQKKKKIPNISTEPNFYRKSTYTTFTLSPHRQIAVGRAKFSRQMKYVLLNHLEMR